MFDVKRAKRRSVLQALGMGAAGLGATTGVISAGLGWINGAKPARAAGSAANLSAQLTSLLGVQNWLNTEAVRPQDIRGKVVLVNFWTYSCINSLRMLP